MVLLVDSLRRRVNRYVRNTDGTWTLSDHEDGVAPLAVLDLSLPLDDIYNGAQAAMARAAAEADGLPDR